ncbi:MAG: TIGR04295 family B12-binding domain-containing radical SAM protein [Acidobacteriaceae bacterium]|nr:TIGR04295 family B12-binding domain-containing radical SAM protein [Acidobacteriaceae bacterium]MBV9780646.1 TIGR04295 family B12-binding domain-containing radical SAM protein [Acidobacteriaceae bacterium]
MRYALINPPWDFEGSIYFGCRERHLPLEFGYSKALLEQAGHEVTLIDGHLDDLAYSEIVRRASDFRPDVIVVTTAPTYLFWRCAPPELRIPQILCDLFRELPAKLVVVGPHASTTPAATLKKLRADVVVLGECEEILPKLAGDLNNASSIAFREDANIVVRGPNRAADMKTLPALSWPDEMIAKHKHHHHRFDAEPIVPGAEMEASRGCPYHCTFCAKDNFRNNYRKRPLNTILQEVDQFLSQGVEYIYFIDEIFLPDLQLLSALAERKVKIGVQTRIDLWNENAIEALARAGCVSIEAGVESITEAGRAYLDKKCKLSTDDLASRLIYARKLVPFVQANLLAMTEDDEDAVESWRQQFERHGVWANKPVPLFPYPGSPEYTRMWGAPDDFAWERAHETYLKGFDAFSDIQDQRPQPLVELETRRAR